ncbi:hypothetical protein MKEN_00284400 [Mycena kentingensis (nom. inval.)]|nr:hypothetical protein MKEN_00284400 [Mycena kentingensis (nom. inval.)]
MWYPTSRFVLLLSLLGITRTMAHPSPDRGRSPRMGTTLSPFLLPSLQGTLRPQTTMLRVNLNPVLTPRRTRIFLHRRLAPQRLQRFRTRIRRNRMYYLLTAYSLVFADCGARSPFILCHCADAEMSPETAIDRLARVPVGLRRFLGTLFVMPLQAEDTGISARGYTQLGSGDVHLFGDCSMDLWVHEAAHAMDYADDDNALSSSSGWLDALATDTCTTDDYALTNEIEAFAQLSTTFLYILLHSNTPPPGLEIPCMQNQINYLRGLAQLDPLTLFGNRCDIDDGVVGVRHNAAPRVLDPTRTFATVPLETMQTAAPPSRGRGRNGASPRSSVRRLWSTWGLTFWALYISNSFVE